MSLTALMYFLGASLVLTLAPGPDNTLVVALGIARGRKAAIITALGMCSGISVHTAAAALGLSALLSSSAPAFGVLKYAGAAYLLFLAYKALREHPALPLSSEPGQLAGGWVLFSRGFMMNVINPKVALFFVAFLPQFVTADAACAVWQMLLLGLIFMLQAAVVFSAIGFLAGSCGDFILQRPGLARFFALLSAGIFVALGIKLALAGR